MGFQKGNRGRPKGARSHLGQLVIITARELKIDPYEILLLFAAGDWKALGYDSAKQISHMTEGGAIERYVIDPSIRCKAAAEAASYIYPKLKTIEYKKSNELEDMTPEQRLEAMRHAVKMLEIQVDQKDKNAQDKRNKNSD